MDNDCKMMTILYTLGILTAIGIIGGGYYAIQQDNIYYIFIIPMVGFAGIFMMLSSAMINMIKN